MRFPQTLPLLGGKRGLTGRTGRAPENDKPRINYHSLLELAVLMKLLLFQTESTNNIDRRTCRETRRQKTEIERKTSRHTKRTTDRKTERQRERQTKRFTGRQQKIDR